MAKKTVATLQTSSKRLTKAIKMVKSPKTGAYTFVESVKATYPFYVIRVMGGLLYLSGMIIMLWNTLMTVTSGRATLVSIPAPAHD